MKRWVQSSFTAALAVFFSQITLAENADARHKIFILHSYEKSHVCGRPQSLGVQRTLLQAGFGVDEIAIQSYAMDSKRSNNTPELIAKQAEIALQKIRTFKPDILVTLDDNAFRTVALELVDEPLQVVFSGMNNQPSHYNNQKHWMTSRDKPGRNITGVYEKIHFVTAVKVQKKIQPGLQKLLIVADQSPTGRAIIQQIEKEIEETPLPVEHEIFITDSWEGYQQKINQLKHAEIDALYPVALLLKDHQGKSYTADEILAWTSEYSHIPSIPLNFAFVELGLFGGAGVDFEAMGSQAGEMVVKILRGERAGNIPIQEANRYALVFNLKRAKTLGIEIPSDILLAADSVYQ